MIQHPIPTWQDLSWQDELKSLITDPLTLLERLKLGRALLPQAEAAARLFPLRVTQSFVNRMRLGDPDDPLLRQVLPLGAELHSTPGYTDDPLEEARFNPIPGLVHKYHNRVLIISTTSCAINCRYCFRREFDYKNNRLTKADWQAIFDYIAARPQVDEVILSGGEPLLQSDSHFAWLLNQLELIKHLKRVRIHSRLPIVLPSRMTPALMASFQRSRLQATLVIHCNHAAEIDNEVGSNLITAREAGFTVLNQSVLLGGINDTLKQQLALAERLFEFKILPYYLHMLDRVSGISHFEVAENKAFALYKSMRATLPGYMLPKLVREQAGEDAKTILSPI